ncbi:NAD-dependent epimerase/dehydratase family protein [Fictibacillus fluitans]|uniref:NAD-dependent epimerase/dehydratase family protein n=1 Tax=Fictibacillus fluitans TaxID=3058422 RepID=A0ABT8HVW5_9BACL|nr:NAD-dependent epimerase/dehydratase family protein [Fictibacillus sp. NE201]MDN4524923.1 NAD-dependent epimerase/dehydratase family protein [Fictibacillus sp. NE201]
MNTIQELEEVMTKPSERLIEDIKQLNGDIMILGVGGKMGPSMARLAKRAVDAGNLSNRVIGVSRFTSGTLRTELKEAGIETISADLLKEEDLQKLPDTENIIYMAGHKFGTTGNEQYTWAMNTYLPGRVAERFPNARHVVFSTGNVYPLVPLAQGGCDETHLVHPVGEYAQSCLGRERIYSYFSRKNGTPVTLFRLNYAIDMKYGVLLEIAKQVYQEKPVDVRMGHVNVIWQGDANEYALRSLLVSESPPSVLNITGPETVSIRWLAQQFAERFGKRVTFAGEEQPTALLSNSSKAHQLFGYPSVTLNTMIAWTADWIKGDGQTIDKPTHFQERQGAF